MRLDPSARRGARLGAALGLACGVVYAVGGLVVDLATVGLNAGTALAFGALGGMPLLGAAAGLAVGAGWAWALGRRS